MSAATQDLVLQLGSGACIICIMLSWQSLPAVLSSQRANDNTNTNLTHACHACVQVWEAKQFQFADEEAQRAGAGGPGAVSPMKS